MNYFEAFNSNDMATKVYTSLKENGVYSNSRNGPVLKFPNPVMLCYKMPWHRANFTKGRDANIFFHIAESVWMLAGQKDVNSLAMFNKNMALYSDDGETFNAAYGHRIRQNFNHDQLIEVVNILRNDPESRQAVIQLWDHGDLTKDTKDKACNLVLVFSITEEEEVQLMVYNRSNDAVYGNVTGANPVHMSYFQQYVADSLSRNMGKLYFTSTNLHVYTELYPHWGRMEMTSTDIAYPKYANMGSLIEYELLWHDIKTNKNVLGDYKSPQITEIIKPLLSSFLTRKFKNLDRPYREILSECQCGAIRTAAENWYNERK